MATSLGSLLKQTRSQMGYKSARAFYLFLKKRAQLDFNYSYYVRIENGKVLPSHKILSNIATILKGEAGDSLVLAYCSELFPGRFHLFSSNPDVAPPPVASVEVVPLRGQKFLSLRQVHVIASSQIHYFIFLIVTLARKPVTLKNLKLRFKGETLLEKAVRDLEEVRVLQLDNGEIFSLTNELRFPKAVGKILINTYLQLDHWDKNFSEFFEFEKNVEKFLLRRVSPRFIGLLQAQLNFIVDLTKSSEEMDSTYNEDVLMLSLKMAKGKLPG